MARRAGAKPTKPRRRHQPAATGASRVAPAPSRVATSTPAGAAAKDGDAVEPEAIVATYVLDARPEGDPYDATVRFRGRRNGVVGLPRPSDAFVQDEVITGIVPGTGPVSITTWVYGLQPGEWNVEADLVRGAGPGQSVRPATWSWRRWAVVPTAAAPIRTRWALLAPLARQPAVMPGIYTALAILGIAVAVLVQAWILGGWGVSVRGALITSAAAIVSGLIGAKLLYAALHPDESIIRGGWAVDGFLLVFPVVAAVTLRILQLPIGTVLDASTPGVFLAVAIGRIGCFVTGCCAGRCTTSRWGIWSSDRRVGARRVPTQLLESIAGLIIALITFAIISVGRPAVGGLVFAGAFATYAVVRQVLLRMRVEQRASPRSLPLTAIGAAIVVVVVAVLALTQGF